MALKLLHHLETFSICHCTQCALDQNVCSVLKTLKYLCCELSDFCECLRKKRSCESSGESDAEADRRKKLSLCHAVSSSSSDECAVLC